MKTEYDPSIIDPEMVTIVENFNKAGIKTLFSCQGHFKESFDGGGQSTPYLLTELPEDLVLYKYIFSSKYPNIKIEIEPFFDLEDSELDILDNFTNLEEYKSNIDKVLSKSKGYRLYFGMNYLFYNIDEKLYDVENEDDYRDIFEFLRRKFLIDMELLSVDLLNVRKEREL